MKQKQPRSLSLVGPSGVRQLQQILRLFSARKDEAVKSKKSGTPGPQINFSSSLASGRCNLFPLEATAGGKLPPATWKARTPTFAKSIAGGLRHAPPFFPSLQEGP